MRGQAYYSSCSKHLGHHSKLLYILMIREFKINRFAGEINLVRVHTRQHRPTTFCVKYPKWYPKWAYENNKGDVDNSLFDQFKTVSVSESDDMTMTDDYNSNKIGVYTSQNRNKNQTVRISIMERISRQIFFCVASWRIWTMETIKSCGTKVCLIRYSIKDWTQSDDKLLMK